MTRTIVTALAAATLVAGAGTLPAQSAEKRGDQARGAGTTEPGAIRQARMMGRWTMGGDMLAMMRQCQQMATAMTPPASGRDRTCGPNESCPVCTTGSPQDRQPSGIAPDADPAR